MEKYVKKLHSTTNIDEEFITKCIVNWCDVQGLSVEDGVNKLVEESATDAMNAITYYAIDDYYINVYLVRLSMVSGSKFYELVIMFFNWLGATNLSKEDGLKELYKYSDDFHSDDFVISRLAKHATNGKGLKI